MFVLAILIGVSTPVIAQGAWTTKAPSTRGTGAGAVGAINGVIYIAAGSSGGTALTTVGSLAYRTTTDNWSATASTSLSRAGGASGVMGGLLYWVGGGINGDANATTGAMEIYDPVANAWSSGTAMPTAREGVAAAVVNG